MQNLLLLVLNTVVNVGLWLFFIRFLLQFAQMDKKNPYVATAYRLSAAADVFGRIFPPVNKNRVNTAALVLMFLLWLIGIAGKAAIAGKSLSPIALFFGGSVSAVVVFLSALKWTILASVVCSLIALFSQKMHPLIEIALGVSDPLLQPFRKIVPNLGGLDFSPLVAILAYSFLANAVGILAGELWLRAV